MRPGQLAVISGLGVGPDGGACASAGALSNAANATTAIRRKPRRNAMPELRQPSLTLEARTIAQPSQRRACNLIRVPSTKVQTLRRASITNLPNSRKPRVSPWLTLSRERLAEHPTARAPD